MRPSTASLADNIQRVSNPSRWLRISCQAFREGLFTSMQSVLRPAGLVLIMYKLSLSRMVPDDSCLPIPVREQSVCCRIVCSRRGVQLYHGTTADQARPNGAERCGPHPLVSADGWLDDTIPEPPFIDIKTKTSTQIRMNARANNHCQRAT